jgi:hypothetical protein
VKNGEQETVECGRHERRLIDYCSYPMRFLEYVQKAQLDDGAANPVARHEWLANKIK